MGKTIDAILAIAFIVCVGCASITLSAQQNGQQNSSPSAPPSPGGGITSGTAPIETTLFAYRSLSSDVDAISREILALTSGQADHKIVIGTAADVAAFAQWRAIMAEAILLDTRAETIHADFPAPPPDGSPTPLPTLSVTETHTAGSLTQGRTIVFALSVSSISGTSGAAGPVTIVDTLPTGWSVSTATPSGGRGWTCNPAADRASISCTRNDPLNTNSSYPIIQVYATVGPPPPPSGPAPVEIITLTGGGAAPQAPLSITLPIPSAAPGGGGANRGAVPPAPPAGAQSPPAASPAAGAGGPLSAVTAAIPVFATVLSQAFAVTETFEGSQGSMTDAPLINMVAERLQEAGVATFIPSVYTPHLLRNATLGDTYLWQELLKLEIDRATLWNDVANASKTLAKATYIVQNPGKYNTTDFTAALEYSGQLQSLITSAQAVATSIDSFETSLFGGQATQSQQQSQNPQNQNANSPGNPSSNPSGNVTNNPSGNPINNAPGNQTNNASGNAGNSPTGTPGANLTGPTQNLQTGQQSSAPPGQQANILPQILGSDLLAHALWGDPNWVSNSDDASAVFNKKLNTVNFLIVHALESGGSQLTKSHFFYGTHIFFSGGAVATFGLFQVSGEVICSGLAYDYEGNVREKKYDRGLRLPQLPAIVTTDFSSCKKKGAKPQISLQKGMTSSEAFANASAPYRTIAVNGNNYTYEFDDVDRTRIVIRDGIVIKVMKH